MNNNVGKVIKVISIIIGILVFILCLLIPTTIATFLGLANDDSMMTIIVLICVLVSFTITCFLYGFGEIVDRICEIAIHARNLKEIEHYTFMLKNQMVKPPVGVTSPFQVKNKEKTNTEKSIEIVEQKKKDNPEIKQKLKSLKEDFEFGLITKEQYDAQKESLEQKL